MGVDVASQGCCGRWWSGRVCSEVRHQLILAWPLCVTQLSQFTFSITATIFCGHMGKTQLDAVALANSLFNVLGLSIIIGLSTSCETLFAQIYGSANKKLVGVVLLRALVVLTLAMLPCIAVHINGENLLLLLGQDPVIANLTADYLIILIPGLLSFVWYIVLARYMQNQNVLYPTMIAGLVANAINILMHYVFIYVLGMGIMGSAISQAISYTLMSVFNVAYMVLSKMYKETWDGFSWEFLRDWGQFCALAFAGLMMVCIEWWSFEVGVILSGVVGDTELGTQTIMMQFETLSYMIPRGMAFAASISIGQHLGAGDPKAARLASKVIISISFATGVILACILCAFNHSLPHIFTSDQGVIDMAADVLPYLSLVVVFDGITCSAGGVLRGTGRQKIGAAIVAVTYTVGVGLAVYLLFWTPYSVAGFWLGLGVAVLIQAILLLIVVLRQDWEKGVQEAKVRAKEDDFLKQQEQSKSDFHETSLMEDKQQPVDETTSLLSSSCQKFEDDPSLKVLLLNRSIVVFIIIAILVLGICCRFLFPPPEIEGFSPAGTSDPWNLTVTTFPSV